MMPSFLSKRFNVSSQHRHIVTQRAKLKSVLKGSGKRHGKLDEDKVKRPAKDAHGNAVKRNQNHQRVPGRLAV